MKRNLLIAKPLFFSIFLIFIFLTRNTEAQTILWGDINAETPVVKGGDNGQLNINFTIGGGMTDGSIEVRLPNGVSYANNLTFTRSGSGTITHNGSSPSNKPVFLMGSVANGEVISISFDRSFSCSALSSVADTIIAFDNMVQVGTRRVSPLYNIQGASLSVSGVSNTPSLASVGTNVTRKISITNQNFGYVKRFSYLDKFPANSYQVNINSFVISSGSTNFPVPSSYIKLSPTNDSIVVNFDTTLIKHIGDYNVKFERNEEFELSYVLIPLNCGVNGSILSNLSAWWGCNGSICQTGTAAFNMDINYSGSPNLVVTNIAPSKVCLGLLPNAYTARIINNGNGPATNVSLELYAFYNNGSKGAYYVDTASVMYKVGVNGPYIHPTCTNVQVRSGAFYSAPNNCSIAGQPHRFTINIPYIANSDSVFINYNVHICNSNYCSPASNSAYFYMNGIYYNLSYYNQCGLNNYSQTNAILIPYSGPTIITTTQFPADISDTQTKEFSVLVSNESFSYSSNSFVRSTAAYYEITINLPAGIEFDNSMGDGVRWYNASHSSYWNGATITGTNPVIARFPISGIISNTANSELVYKLKGVCGTSGEKTISMSYKFVPDPGNVCGISSDIQLMCFSKTVNLHCPTAFPAGANFYYFDQSRKNYGLVDNNNDGMPDGSGTMNMTYVKKDRLMYGDTLKTVFKSVIKTDGANPLFQYVYAKLAIGSLNTNFSYTIPASVRIKRASDGSVITGTVVATRVSDSIYYNISTLGSNAFYNGDSIEVISNLVVKTNIGGAYNSYISRGDLYASHVANPVGANRFSSDFWSSTVSIIGYYFTIWQQSVNPLSFSNGCENKQLSIGYYLSIGPCCSNYSGGNLFPYEVRRWNFLDSLKITMPDGYTIVTSTFNNYRTGVNNSTVTEVGGTINPISVSGNIYTYRFKDFYYQYGGNKINIGDDGWFITQVFTIQSSGLIKPMYVIKPVPITTYFGSVSQIPATIMSSTGSQLVFSGAIPDLIANTPIVDAYTKNIQWKSTLQNSSATITAPNSWLYIKKRNNDITINELKYDNIVVPPDVNGFYRIGTLNGGAIKSINIKATSNSCSSDSLKIFTGYSCDGLYPVSFNSSTTAKLDSVTLVVQPKLAQITANLTSLANTPTNPADPNSPLYGSDYVTMCDSFPVQLQIISAQPANIYNIRELIQLPTNVSGNAGISFASGSAYIEYPVGTTPRPFSAAANNALSVPGLTNLTLDLAQIDPANFGAPTAGLKGSLNPDSNKVILRFKFTTNCELPSRSAFKVTSKAKAPCGANALGDGAFVSSSVLPIFGVFNSNAANVDLSLSPSTTFTSCDSSKTALLILEKIGPNPISITDSVYVTMPSIFNILGPVTCNGTYCPGPNPIIKNDVVGDQRIIRWQYPQNFNSLPNNGSGLGVSYSFTVVLNDINFSTPLAMSMNAQVVEQSIVMCGLNACPNSTSIIGESDLNVQIGGSIIGVSKDITEVQYINNFSYDVTYRMIVRNYGNTPLSNVQVSDTLTRTFSPLATFSIVSKTATGSLVIATNYNGSTVCGLLDNTSSLDVNASDTIILKVNISTNGNFGPFYNQSYAQAYNSYSCISRDLSDFGNNPDPDGDNNPNELGENDPTPLQFNAPPITYNEYVSVDEDNILNGLSILGNGDIDPDGTTLTIDTIPLVSTLHGTISMWSNGTYVYTPDPNYNGNDMAVFNICDAGLPTPGLCTADTIFIVVNPVNDPPLTFNENETTDENIPIIKNAASGILSNADFDPDGTALFLNTTPVHGPLHGIITIVADGGYTYTPAANYNGYDTIIVSVCDNGIPMPSLCTNDTIFITIGGTNNPPVTYNETETTNEDIPLVKTAADGILSNGDYDPENTMLTVNTSAVVAPAFGNIIINTDGSYTYTPFNNYNGRDTVVFSVCDNGIPLPAECSNDTLYIQVLPINDPPVTVNESLFTTVNTPIIRNAANGILSNGDMDPDTTALSVDTLNIVGPLHGTLDMEIDGSFVYTPNLNYYGYDTIIVDVCDSGNPLPSLCTKDTVFIQITLAGNQPPVAVNNYIEVPENSSMDVDPNSNNYDPDNNIDITATTIILNAQNGTTQLNATNGVITYTPNLNYVGYDTIVVSICDTGIPVYCTNDTIFVEVIIPENHPPVAVNNYVVIPANTLIEVNPNSNNYDPDNNIDTTATTIIRNAQNGLTLLNSSNGRITYTPNANYLGYDTIVVNICDTGLPVFCTNDTIFIQVIDTSTVVPVIGIAKTYTQVLRIPNGGFNITYLLTLQNIGKQRLTDIEVLDSLSKVFPYPAECILSGVPVTTGNIVANTAYDGQYDFNLLNSASSVLEVGETATITFTVSVLLKDTSGIFSNTAYISALGLYGINSFDISDNGTVADPNGNGNPNESGENDPTTIELHSSLVFIPQGFSPNGDGIDDVFVIYGTGHNRISISIYNRWGNLVYQENDYQNDWGGKANKGLTTNSDLPEGNYFYVIDLHNGQKNEVGSFIIKR